MRAFIAVDISDEAREEISRAQEILSLADSRMKWVVPGNVHITLKFLGDIDVKDLPSIEESIKKAVRGKAPFDIVISGIGAFPSWRRPSVIWLGVGEGEVPLITLFKDIDSAMSGAGFAPENREFKPHISLGRVKGKRNLRELAARAQEMEISPVKSRIDSLILFRSTLKPSGAEYDVIFEVPI